MTVSHSHSNTPTKLSDAALAAQDSARFRKPAIWIVLTSILTITALSFYTRRVPEPPPILYKVTDFSLTNQDGQVFGSQELAGQVYIAYLFFSNCKTVCPLITKSAHDLQARFEERKIPVKLVGITVDPSHDTPEKLLQFGSANKADFGRWSFLTGTEEKIRALALEGFKLNSGERVNVGPTLYDIAHSPRFVLVDAAGNVRGYYDSGPDGVDEVFHRSQHVLWGKK